ncbi:MAG: crossover junction endodeoxyribonuclease RuvC [Actinomycetota bacterium]
MRVIGIDPGIATTGYAVVERHGARMTALAVGVVRTARADGQALRLARLGRALETIVTAHEPQVAAIERLFFNSNAKTAMAVGQASGVALASAAELGLEVVDYTPLEVKQSVVGVGNAGKHQVQAMVTQLLRLARPPTPADAADACALALCHLNRTRLAAAIRAAQ